MSEATIVWCVQVLIILLYAICVLVLEIASIRLTHEPRLQKTAKTAVECFNSEAHHTRDKNM